MPRTSRFDDQIAVPQRRPVRQRQETGPSSPTLRFSLLMGLVGAVFLLGDGGEARPAPKTGATNAPAMTSPLVD